MIQRVFFLAIVAAALVTLIVISQLRSSAHYVSGVIEADEIRLGSRVGGRVKSVLVAEGDSVTAGAALVEFEPFDLNEREQQAVSLLAEREAALNLLSTGMRTEEIEQAKARFDRAAAQLSLVQAGPRAEEIAAADNRIQAASAESRLAKKEYDRVVELFQSNALAKTEFDQASERMAAAAALLEVRQNELQILKSGSREQEIQIAQANAEEARLAWELAKQGFRKEQTEQAVAARNAAQSALDAIRQQKNELTIRASSDGSIDALDLQPGDLVPPNAPVLTMLSTNELWVRAYVPQRFMQIQVGQTVRVTIDSFPGTDFQGTITFISSQAEFTPSNVQTPDDRAKQVYRIRVRIQSGEHSLRPGITANVWLDSLSQSKQFKPEALASEPAFRTGIHSLALRAGSSQESMR